MDLSLVWMISTSWDIMWWVSHFGEEQKGHIEFHFLHQQQTTCTKKNRSNTLENILNIQIWNMSPKHMAKKGVVIWNCCTLVIKFTNLYFVVRWCRRTKISNLANSFPGHMWIPLPNGIKVLGFGAACKSLNRIC